MSDETKLTIVMSLFLLAVIASVCLMLWSNLRIQKKMFEFEREYSPQTETAIPMPEWTNFTKAPTGI